MTTLAPAIVVTNPLNFLAMAHNICSKTRWVIIPHTFSLEKSIDTNHILAGTSYYIGRRIWIDSFPLSSPQISAPSIMDPLELSMRAHDYSRLTRVYISII